MTNKTQKPVQKKTKQMELVEAIASLFANGSPEERDALRTVANSVLNTSNRFRLETKEAMNLTQAYSHLTDLPLTGKQARVCKPDEVYPIEALLHKDIHKNFADIMHNLATTLVYTSTENFDQTNQPKVWGCAADDNASLLRRVFMYWLTQEGVKQVFRNIEPFCHTKLPMFVFSVFEDDNDVTNGNILGTHLSDIFNADLATDTLGITSSLLPVVPEPVPVKPHTEIAIPSFQTMRYALINEAGEDPEDVDEMDNDEVTDAWKRHNGIPVEGDEDEEEDEEDDIPCWRPGTMEIAVRPELPTVVVPTVEGRRVKTKTKSGGYVTLPPSEWHKLPDCGNYNYYWAIHVISRPTTSLEVNTATLAEALLIAQTITDC